LSPVEVICIELAVSQHVSLIGMCFLSTVRQGMHITTARDT